MGSIRLVVVLALAGGVAHAAKPKVKEPPPPGVVLIHANTHERYKLQPDRRGRFNLKGWNRFLRCHHTGRKYPMSPKLARVIYETAKHFEFKPITVVAGFRARKVAKQKGNPKSPHPKGLAVDFYVRDVKNTELRDYLRTVDGLGVGYYPNSSHVHVDVRKGKAFWIDYSAQNEKPRYSKNPDLDLEEEKVATTQAPLPSIPMEGAPTPETGTSPGAPAPNPPALEPVTP